MISFGSVIDWTLDTVIGGGAPKASFYVKTVGFGTRNSDYVTVGSVVHTLLQGSLV